MPERALIEAVGPAFDRARLLAARAKAWEALDLIAARITPGMTVGQAVALAQATLDGMGFEKNWHRVTVRFGAHTMHRFTVPLDVNAALGESDSFFLDLGPVWQGHEADVGRTFVVGGAADRLRCKTDAEEIWAELRGIWARERPSGAALYERAAGLAARRGWTLQLDDAAGHRLSDFPHHLHYRGSISEIDWFPAPDAWVLEVQLIDPRRRFGAFYEDLLT